MVLHLATQHELLKEVSGGSSSSSSSSIGSSSSSSSSNSIRSSISSIQHDLLKEVNLEL